MYRSFSTIYFLARNTFSSLGVLERRRRPVTYIKHDDRGTRMVRNLKRRNTSDLVTNDWQSLPVGWRNVRKACDILVRREDDDTCDGNGYGSSGKTRRERSSVDEVWKHDLFDEAE
ncbi:unnamed protein product [Gongylonema pulchrum]|uniref:Uncharacterized protein n=1 Tax=Gongylonema pulchrum TaxID=637853 RepID=A0A183DU44_9BILA|nr:unnamed protein product [Gongylonema pulchrum]